MLATRQEQMSPTPSEQLMEVAEQLAVLAARFDRSRDSRAIFTTAYVLLTRKLARALTTDVFYDPSWIADLARTFGRYYIEAIQAFDAGHLPKGAWATVFTALQQRRTSVLEDLVLGMTAHIVNDLPQALCEVGMVRPDGTTRIRDFHAMNDVLGTAIEEIQDAIEDRYDGSLRFLDHMLESYDELLTNYGLRTGRAAAWYNAVRLLDKDSHDVTLEAISRSPEITLNTLLNPPVRSLRLLLRGGRLLSRCSRHWPDS